MPVDSLKSGILQRSIGNRCLTINESGKMKKIYSFMVAAVAVFGAVACTQELDNNVPEANGETVVFTAYADGADETKTVLNGTNSLWKAGDRIWIMNG